MTKWIVILGFMVAFGAGLAAGARWRPVAAGNGNGEQRPRDRSGWLASELSLTAEQQKAMDAIWSETARSGRREQEERRRQLRREREEEIAALVRPEDLGKYDDIQKRYAEQVAALDREVREQFATAVDKSKHVLRPEQQKKYEDILKRHQWGDRGGRDGGGGGRDRGDGNRERGGRDGRRDDDRRDNDGRDNDRRDNDKDGRRDGNRD